MLATIAAPWLCLPFRSSLAAFPRCLLLAPPSSVPAGWTRTQRVRLADRLTDLGPKSEVLLGLMCAPELDCPALRALCVRILLGDVSLVMSTLILLHDLIERKNVFFPVPLRRGITTRAHNSGAATLKRRLEASRNCGRKPPLIDSIIDVSVPWEFRAKAAKLLLPGGSFLDIFPFSGRPQCSAMFHANSWCANRGRLQALLVARDLNVTCTCLLFGCRRSSTL